MMAEKTVISYTDLLPFMYKFFPNRAFHTHLPPSKHKLFYKSQLTISPPADDNQLQQTRPTAYLRKTHRPFSQRGVVQQAPKIVYKLVLEVNMINVSCWKLKRNTDENRAISKVILFDDIDGGTVVEF